MNNTQCLLYPFAVLFLASYWLLLPFMIVAWCAYDLGRMALVFLWDLRRLRRHSLRGHDLGD